jgi:two-component system sensor histidine kinase BaeS
MARRSSYALRLALAFAVVALVAAGLTALLVNLAFGQQFGAYLSAQQQAEGHRIVSELSSSYLAERGWNQAALQPVGAAAAMEGVDLTVENGHGQTLWPTTTSASSGMGAMDRAMMGSGGLGAAVHLPILVDGRVVGTAVVAFSGGGQSGADNALRGSVDRLAALAALIAALVALGVGTLLARRVTGPVRTLTAAAKGLAGGDWSARVDSVRTDELGEMARAFDHMAEKLSEEDSLRRTFIADVAHELRTPLAVVRAELEAIEDGLIPLDPAALASFAEEVERLCRLVGDLGTLALADAAGFSLHLQLQPLAPVVEGAVNGFAGTAQAKGVQIGLHLDEDALAEVDGTRMAQVVANLVSNALKFTPAGGRVDLRLHKEGSFAVLEVTDTGPGIRPQDLRHVFERFWSGGTPHAGGSGIGLAVVRELVDAHGGRVDVISELGKGAAFTVRLPQAVSPLQKAVINQTASVTPIG